MRRYFILNRPSADELTALESCIGDNSTQRYSLDGNKLLIKTNKIIIDNYLKTLTDKLGTEYSLTEIKNIMATPEWTSPDELIWL